MDQNPYQHWQDMYASTEDAQLGWYQETPSLSLDLIQKHAATVSAGLIDVGGGTSSLIDHLLDRDFVDMTLLDMSEPAIDRVKARLIEYTDAVSFICGDITSWQPKKKYNIWHDRACLHFLLNEVDKAAYKKALDAATVAGSIIILGAFAPDGPKACRGIAIQQYGLDDFRNFLGDGYELLSSEKSIHMTPSQAEHRYCTVAFKRL